MPHNDEISIQSLRLQTIVGVYEFERHEKREIMADLKIRADLSKAAHSDALSDTIDYFAIAAALTQKADESKHLLLEKLAFDLLKTTFAIDARILSVEIRLTKNKCIENAASAQITLNRQREAFY